MRDFQFDLRPEQSMGDRAKHLDAQRNLIDVHRRLPRSAALLRLPLPQLPYCLVSIFRLRSSSRNRLNFDGILLQQLQLESDSEPGQLCTSPHS